MPVGGLGECAVKELLDTERTFVNRLSVVYEAYKLHADEFLSEQERKLVFGNIEDILIVNSNLLQALESCDLNKMPFILEDYMRNHMVQPYSQYCCHHKRANEWLRVNIMDAPNCSNNLEPANTKGKKQKNATNQGKQRISDFIAKGMSHPGCQGLDLASFLLEPVQRVARYPLLLRNTIDISEAWVDALKASQWLLDTVNTAVAEFECEERLLELDCLLVWEDFKVNLIEKTRLGMKRSLLVPDIYCLDQVGNPVIAHLFTDFLLSTDGNQNDRVIGHPWPIEQIDFDGSCLSYYGTTGGNNRLIITHNPDDDNEMIKVRVREALDTAQSMFYAGLDQTDTVDRDVSGQVAGVVSVVWSGYDNLYTLPSKYNRTPVPFVFVKCVDREGLAYQKVKLPHTSSRKADLLVEGPEDQIIIEVYDDRPFGEPIFMGRHTQSIGDYLDYFDGVEGEIAEVKLEGVPRGTIKVSFSFKSL